jgi:hypothetical protein
MTWHNYTQLHGPCTQVVLGTCPCRRCTMPCFFPAVPCAGRSGRAYCIHGSSQHNAQRKTWPPGRLSMSIFRHVGHLLLDQSVVHHGCPTAMHITVLQGFWGRKGLWRPLISRRIQLVVFAPWHHDQLISSQLGGCSAEEFCSQQRTANITYLHAKTH